MSGFLQDLTVIAQYAGEFLVAFFKTMAGIFVSTVTTGEGSAAVTTTQFTIFGVLLMFSSLIGLGIWIVDWIRGLITIRRG